MNVRFFSGTRQQYDSLPSYNELGLYFCADTHELFWCDRLLTDGMRVVDRFVDLPDPMKAADGVVYYVTSTRNGYVVPHGTNKWLQTIYAPAADITEVPESERNTTSASVGAVVDVATEIFDDIAEITNRVNDLEESISESGVKTIMFAGTKFTEVDGVFILDRISARKALGFIVPAGQENLDIEIATKAELDRVENKIPSVKGLASEEYVNSKIDEIIIPEVPTKVSEFENDAEYVTASELAAKGYITDISGKADKNHKHDDLYEAKGAAEAVKNELLNGAGEAFNTLKELGDLISNNKEAVDTLTTIASTKADKEHTHDDYAKTSVVAATMVAHKYEVIPFEGAIINYSDNEVRVNTQHVDVNKLPQQNAGDGSSNNYYYMTFRAYAPADATSVVEGQSDKMDTEHSTLAVDAYGRKYTTIWAAIANKVNGAWSKFGDKSTSDKYLGFYYNFHWYNGDQLIGMDKVRVILTNDACHNDLVPDAVARRIDEKVAEIVIPDVSEFVTESAVDTLLDAKADSILFTDDMRVNSPIGDFTARESVQNMTIKDIVTKLLGLTLYVPVPDVPDGTSEAVQELMVNKLAPYMLGEDGAPVATEYDYRIMTPEEAKEDNQEESFLYQVIKDGVVIESGYQIATVYQENDYLTVLIPSTITDFAAVDYSTLDGNWTASSWTLAENSNYHVAGYKAYTVPEEFGILSGIAIRIIINN